MYQSQVDFISKEVESYITKIEIFFSYLRKVAMFDKLIFPHFIAPYETKYDSKTRNHAETSTHGLQRQFRGLATRQPHTRRVAIQPQCGGRRSSRGSK